MPQILYIDDDTAHLELFKANLQGSYEIHCAESAKDAMEILKKNKIQVLIADQRMPDMTGIDLMEYASEKYPNVVRIILSAYNDFQTVIDAINKGKIQSYLLKSFNTDEINIAIQNALETSYLRGKNQKLIDELSKANMELKRRTQLLELDIKDRKKTVKERTSELEKEVLERKKAEETIRASEEKFRLTFENASIGKSLTTPDGKLSKVNKAFCDLLGYNAEELESKGFADVTHPDDLAESKECVRRQLAGEQDTYNFEKRYICKDGKIVWTDVNTILLRDVKGNPMYFMTHVIDRTKRKEAENALQNSEKRYRTLIENIPGAVFRCYMDDSWTMQYLSDAIKNICGYPASDFINNTKRTFGSIIHPDDQQKITNVIQKALINNKKYESEYRILHKNGTIVWVYEKGQIIVDQKGMIDFLDGIIIDITGRKREQELINESQGRYSAIAKNLPNGIIHILDREFRYVFNEGEELQRLGLTNEMLEGKTIYDVLPPDKAKTLGKQYNRVLNGQTISFEDITGEDTFLINAAPLRDTENEVIQILVLSINITARKKAQKELDKERKLLNTFMNNVPDKIYFKDINSRFIRINKAMACYFGLNNPEEAMGKTDFNFFSDEHAQQAYNDEQEMIKTGVAIRKAEKETWPDGRKNWVSTVKLPFLNEEGKVTGTFGISRDITELKQLMDELEKAKKDADAANRAKSEFLANMSHEIRTPMNAVLGYAELLTPLLRDKIQSNYLKSIRTSGNSLLTLINDILDLSKIEAGKLELTFGYIDTQSFFSEMEHIFSYKKAEKGLNFFLEISSGTPASIYIDEIRLRQILVNLLGNAFKFTKNGYVKLSVWTETPQLLEYRKGKIEEYIDLVMEVEDTGIGISKEFQEEIFDEFQQQEDVSTKNFGGTGLGLSITKKIIKLMSGTITVTSKLNEGSTFKVIIPDVKFKRDLESSEMELYIDPHLVIFDKSTVLVVDDVEHNRKFLFDALRDTNLKLVEAENGEVAINLAREIIPDLIITDIRMPVMDGFELLDKIKTDDKLKHIPVIAYSASVMKSMKEKIQDSEFAGLLMKPVQLADLYLEMINHLPHRILTPDHVSEEESMDEKLPDSVIEKLPKLIKVMESDLYKTWESFSKRQPMGELHKFGETISDFGDQFQIKFLKQYGQQLISAKDEFNIKETLSLLRKYPKLIEKLKEINEKSPK
ncbi:PAS domain S-box protein [Bacteroidota bacterium]